MEKEGILNAVNHDWKSVERPDFMEDILYSSEIPYTIVRQVVPMRQLCDVHYGETMEVMIAQHLEGYMIAYGQRFEMTGAPRVIIILPGVIHSGKYAPAADAPEGEGEIFSFKISLENMNKLLNLETLLVMDGHSLEELASAEVDFYQLFPLVRHLIEADQDSVFERISWLIKIFQLFSRSIPENAVKITNSFANADENINALVLWSREHIKEQIALEDAAKFMNMSRYYFCRYFKKKTSMTYMQFLTQLRIDLASKMLQNGQSATECCYECGFDNISYFVQLFKRKTGYTTWEYRKMHGMRRENEEILSGKYARD